MGRPAIAGTPFTSRMSAAEMSTAAGLLVGRSSTVEKSATCSMDTGCQMPEMPETVWKP